MASRKAPPTTATSAAPATTRCSCSTSSATWSAALRPGNVHSADGWRDVLEPVIARYRERDLRRYFRGDAAFAKPELYELLEAEGYQYAIRLPANRILQEQDRPPAQAAGWPPAEQGRRYYASFSYQAQAGRCRAASWPRSSGTRASFIPASASSSPT